MHNTMNSPDNLLYEYAVIRFMPRIEREEFLNIGLVMLSKRNKWLKSLVLIDDARIIALFPDVDLECLRTQTRMFENADVPAKDMPVEEKYRWLTAVKSACIQLSPSHPGIILPYTNEVDSLQKEDRIKLLEAEFSRLFDSIVL